MSVYYKATQGQLATDLITLSHSQVTGMTPELPPPSPCFHTTPTGGRLSLDRFNIIYPWSSVALGSNSCHTGHESLVITTKLPRLLEALQCSNPDFKKNPSL
ncbi:hypothetical protein TNCV_1111601 [Trichonephila clavipes]|nr:hypothetical protein TNCV_1111601 [Trichonephila clavipes]